LQFFFAKFITPINQEPSDSAIGAQQHNAEVFTTAAAND
jgi:hypothetical protein